ncbi:MAG: stage II sporulation protein D [Clostridia bacterium]|nr:stage II sporulation protein D [Clostridia bacterium]
MKFIGILCVFLALAMIFTPLLSLKDEKPSPIEEKTESVFLQSGEKAPQNISVYLTKKGKTEKMSLSDYVTLSVCAEISPNYEPQAIMAQAVACRTYALYMLKNGSYDKADISDDYTVHQGFIPKSELKEKWGDKFDVYFEKISSCVKAVEDKAIACDGRIIQPAFFALCCGQTENASDVWGGEVKYLKSVVSPGDELSENLTSVVDMTESEFESCCKKLKNCTLPDDKTKWIGKAERTQAGAVKQIAVGNGTYGGAEMQKAFELKSNNFTLEHNGDSFVFTVVGSGHGVGMSQYGADFMARRGSNYEEILKHYYTGVEIVDF